MSVEPIGLQVEAVSCLFEKATILCEGCVCSGCLPSGVVCLDSDIFKVETAQSDVMSMQGIVDGKCEWCSKSCVLFALWELKIVRETDV